MQEAMKDNTKYVIVEKDTNPTLVLDSGNGDGNGDGNGVTPIKQKISIPK